MCWFLTRLVVTRLILHRPMKWRFENTLQSITNYKVLEKQTHITTPFLTICVQTRIALRDAHAISGFVGHVARKQAL